MVELIERSGKTLLQYADITYSNDKVLVLAAITYPDSVIPYLFGGIHCGIYDYNEQDKAYKDVEFITDDKTIWELAEEYGFEDKIVNDAASSEPMRLFFVGRINS